MMEAFLSIKTACGRPYVIISDVVGISMQKQLMFGCLACARLSLYGTEIESPHAPNPKVPFKNTARAG